MLLTVARFVAFLVGLLAYYIAVFMYKDEQGKWQNRIDKLWVVSNRETQSGIKAYVFFSKVATMVTRSFNYFFGKRLFSFQFVGTSICWSFATMLLIALLALLAKRSLGHLDLRSPADVTSFWRAELVVLITGLLFLFLAILPSLWYSRWAVALSLLPADFVFFGFLVALLLRTRSLKPQNWALVLGLVLGLLSDVLLVALVRFTVRWVSVKASALRIGLAILIQLSVVYFLILVPFAIPATFPDDFRQSVGLMSLFMMGGLNIFTAFASLTFVLSLLLLLLHRALWPVLGRLVNLLYEYKVIRNRKVMFSIGTGCFIVACPWMHPTIKSILQWFAK